MREREICIAGLPLNKIFFLAEKCNGRCADEVSQKCNSQNVMVRMKIGIV